MKKSLLTLLLLLVLTTISLPQIGGYALNFDGTNDYVEIPNSGTSVLGDNSANHSFTIETWFKYGGTGWEIFTKHSGSGDNNYGYFLERTGDFKVQAGYGYNGGWARVIGTPTIDNKWHHYAMVYDNAGTISLYIDGVLQGTSATFTPQHSQAAVNLRLMTSHFWGSYTSGKLDEFRVWNAIRTEAEIKANMYKELAGNETNLVAYYKMSSGSGTTLADNQTSGTNPGTISGAVWTASGCFAGPRQALDFDGSNDYVVFSEANSPAYNNSALTIEAWIKSASTRTEEEIVNWGNNANQNVVEFRMSEGSLQFGIDVGGWSQVSSNATVNDGKWNHVAVTKDGNTIKLYINGKLDAGGTITASPSVNRMTIANVFQNNSYQSSRYEFLGLIDEVRIWNSVRTEEQLRENMMNNLSGNESGLIGYYRFDHYDGTTLYDYTNNGKNGTLTNMDPATDWVASTAFTTWIGSENNSWYTGGNWSRDVAPSSDNTGLYKWDGGYDLNISSPGLEGPSGITANNILFSATSNPILYTNISVSGNLFLGKDLNLNGQTINLGSTGYLFEGNYRIYGTSGTITATRTLGELTSENVAGLGAVLSSQGTTVTVSGAGTAAVNGTYTFLDVYEGKNRYAMGDYRIQYYSYSSYWQIGLTEFGDLRPYYFTYDAGINDNPPTTGWTEQESVPTPVPVVAVNTANLMGSTTITRGHTQQGGSSILRYYDITPTTNTGLNASLTFKYDQNEIGSIPENDLRLFKSTDGGSTYTQVGGAVNTTDNTVTLTGINDFSRWTLGDYNQPLPVELSSLTANASGNCVIISWKTSTEVNNYGFDVERSLKTESDMVGGSQNPGWDKIGFVPGAGNSNSPKEYSFTDIINHSTIQAFTHSFRYRLKQIDNDGTFSYSKEVEIENLRPAAFELSQNYPNPFNPSTTIRFGLPSDTRVTLEVFNLIGEKVATLINNELRAGYHQVEFRGDELSSGIYFYRFSAGEFSDSKKMILLK